MIGGFAGRIGDGGNIIEVGYLRSLEFRGRHEFVIANVCAVAAAENIGGKISVICRHGR